MQNESITTTSDEATGFLTSPQQGQLHFDLMKPESDLKLSVKLIQSRTASQVVVANHYLHRRPPISFAYGLYVGGDLVGVCTFGIPPSRHLQLSACPSLPNKVIELNRLWVNDNMARNTESWFVSRCLKLLPPMIVVSYADTAAGHVGYIYRALNFRYAGWTDMERKTPRYDYAVPGRHSRDAFRGKVEYERVRRKPKHKYWIVTGDRRQRKELEKLCGWPSLNWTRPSSSAA